MRALLLLLLLHGPAARARDRWLGIDKLQHFLLSMFAQCVSYSALRTAHAAHGAALAGSSALTATAAVGKEIHDRRHRGDFSLRDLAWDAAGAGTATLFLEHTRR